MNELFSQMSSLDRAVVVIVMVLCVIYLVAKVGSLIDAKVGVMLAKANLYEATAERIRPKVEWSDTFTEEAQEQERPA